MVIKRTVILPKTRSGAFGRVALPDGTEALVLDRGVHESALNAAGKQIGLTLRSIKKEAERHNVRTTTAAE